MKTTTKEIALPKEIRETDLHYPKNFKVRVLHHLDMYYTERFGWCIATLHIRNAGRRNMHRDARTYAVSVNTGGVVRVGLGPHVLRRITVYVTEKRLAALQKFVDLQNKGAVEANEIRDRISTRRAQGQINRANGLKSWLW